MKELELLYELIPDYPGIFIALIEDENYDCAKNLHEFSKKREFTLHVKNLSDKAYEKSLHVESFKFEQKLYNSNATQYDFVFLCADIEKYNPKEISKKIYRILKNAAHLFLISPKDNTDELSAVLEDSNFVALNIIELTPNIDVISAKKMHGWMRV